MWSNLIEKIEKELYVIFGLFKFVDKIEFSSSPSVLFYDVHGKSFFYDVVGQDFLA